VVDIKHHPLAFIYSFFTPQITINGQRIPGRWGPNALPLPPGQHHLRIHIPYILPPEVGRAELTVPVPPGQPVQLEYRAPLVAFMRGALGVGPQKWPGMAVTLAVFGVSAGFVLLMFLLILVSAATG
jgi:hypothetical protein